VCEKNVTKQKTLTRQTTDLTRWRRHLVALLITAVLAVAGYKVFARGYGFSELLPLTRYDVALVMSLDGHGGEVRVRTYLPVSDSRQTVTGEENNSPGLHFSTQGSEQSRRAAWAGSQVPDATEVRYRLQVVPRPVRFELHSELSVPAVQPAAVQPYLKAEPSIQVEAPEIRATLLELGADRGPIVDRLRRIYDFTGGLRQRSFKGVTDALTALRLREASCNGKSRLFVALARSTGIPARLIGGMVMQRGQVRVTHQWIEAYVGGHWVPFDPTNHHFAELPAHYLTLYYGDETLFTHTKETNFKYHYDVDTQLVPSQHAKSTLGRFNVWAMFERLHLPFALLRTLLMLPIGALVVVLFRNVIGLPTFGTFLPALIAAASSETGAVWGLIGLLIVITAVSLGRWSLHELRLLHSPTLAILLTLVAVSMLGTSMLAERLGLMQLTRISLFPIAVLAITAERFYLALVEQSPMEAVKQLGGTLVVIAACYLVMSSLALQIIVIGYPETLLLVIAVNLYLGRWVGMRLLEYRRFRRLVAAPASQGTVS
jgi:transglutaminase-like putative cysteine protease